MKLTGKCKEDFEVWCSNNVWAINPAPTNGSVFYELPEPMQYGVYIDFFDSLGTVVFISTYWDDKQYFQVDVNNLSEYELNTRPEARTAAITKANEMYNKQ